MQILVWVYSGDEIAKTSCSALWVKQQFVIHD